MPLTEEQAKNAKEQIIKHIEATFPQDKKQEAINYLNSLNPTQLEEFLIKNNMIRSEEAEGGEESQAESPQSQSKSPTKTTNCIYCLIANKQVDSLPIYEDKDYMAVLEINPYSKGHTILIPKAHIETSKKMPAKALVLAKKIGAHIIKKLKAENFQINTTDAMKHTIVNIIPTYKGQELKYERKKAKPEELKDLAMTIGKFEKKQSVKKEKKSKESKSETKTENIIQLNRRIA